MEEQINQSKVLTLKSLEKEIKVKFAEYEKRIKALERKVDLLIKVVGGKNGK